MAESSKSTWVELLKVVTKPITFMTLVLLMVEALFGAMIFRFPEKFEMLIYIIIGFFAGYTLIVVLLAIWRPEVLLGTKNWNRNFSNRLADDIYFAVVGYFENLSQQEKIEAWLFLSDILHTQDSGNDEFNDFCKRIGERISKKAQLQNKKLSAQGTIEE